MTEKQRRFVDEYLIDLNATRAYKAAYPSIKNDEAAAACASKLLRKAKVADYVRERMKERQERTEITQDKVLHELAAIAFGDIGEIVTIRSGSVKFADTDQLTAEKRGIIAEVEEGKFGLNVKFCDRLKALELLGRHIGLFDPRKDDLDKKEQEAKIDKLRADIRNSAAGGEHELKVRFVGLDGAEE